MNFFMVLRLDFYIFGNVSCMTLTILKKKFFMIARRSNDLFKATLTEPY